MQMRYLLLTALVLSSVYTSESVSFLAEFTEPLNLEEANELSFMGKLIDEAGELAKSVEGRMNNLTGWISDDCKAELVSLKSIVQIIKEHAGSSDEIIFYSVKDLVDHFPGLREHCKVPLPTINTTNWDFEKFKKYKCSITAISFAVETVECVDGIVWQCVKGLKNLYSLGICIKDILEDLN